jgi:peptidyl-prolyl cis-trans isomerase B (cyclophilin B)
MRFFQSPFPVQALLLGLFFTLTPFPSSLRAQTASQDNAGQAAAETPSAEKPAAKAPKKSKKSKETVQLVELSTKFGSMTIMLYNETPQHRDNFVRLVQEGFYNDLLFHRVIKQFMVQGGDPASKNAEAGAALGSGGPGYTVPAEFNNALIHKKGALSAARTGDNVNPKRASSGSQFYIVQGQTYTPENLTSMAARSGREYTEEQKNAYATLGGTPHLDGQYTVFGQVIKGLEIVDQIAAVPTDSRDRPVENVTMTMTLLKPEKLEKLLKELEEQP